MEDTHIYIIKLKQKGKRMVRTTFRIMVTLREEGKRKDWGRAHKEIRNDLTPGNGYMSICFIIFIPHVLYSFFCMLEIFNLRT